MIIMALVFVGILVAISAYSIANHNASYSFEPGFIPDRTGIAQIVRIAVISPWAFIGFENVAHFSEEYSFPITKVRRILISSVIFTTLVYILMTLLSVSAYPQQYSSWLEYIRDMGNLSGIEAIPAFYAANVYMGSLGVDLMMLSLLCVVITSIIGNLTALSRLLFALGRDSMAPSFLSTLNERGIPSKAVQSVVVLSLFIPFMGRTAIGWIVDVTTLGATVLYGFLSYAVIRDARKRDNRGELITGITGTVLMLGFVVLLLAPKLMTYEAMPSESYFIFAVWAILGLLVFRIVMHYDEKHLFGRSVIVWLLFLLLMLLTTMMWVSRQTQTMTDESMSEIKEYYESHLSGGASGYDEAEAEEFLKERAEKIESLDARNTMFSYGLFILAVIIMLNNYLLSRNREKEWEDELGLVRRVSVTDPLTGVKNRHAFFVWAEDFDKRIKERSLFSFAVAVCDINDLKKVNDTLGHQAGDECIKKASAEICRIFAHSPVFRYGGDEFVVILEGEDYDHMDGLVHDLDTASDFAVKNNGNSIATGIAVYDPKKHHSLLSVFEEADSAMYKRKRFMKLGG